jgi:hypothetical protein
MSANDLRLWVVTPDSAAEKGEGPEFAMDPPNTLRERVTGWQQSACSVRLSWRGII